MRANAQQLTFSSYQQAVFDEIERGRGDIAVNAVAGSGKTTTLVEAASRINSRRVVFVAFNKHIAEELARRLPKHVQAKTVHSFGYGAIAKALGKITVDEHKALQLCDAMLQQRIAQEVNEAVAVYTATLRQDSDMDALQQERDIAAFRQATNARLTAQYKTIAGELKQAVHFAMVSLWHPSSDSLDRLARIIDFYGVALPCDWHAYVGTVITASAEVALRHGAITFDEMLYLTWYWQLPLPKFEYVLCDEAQDFSAAMLWIVQQLRGLGGRIVYVGDPNQAIQGFAGSDPQSWTNILETGAKEMPLSICYRCPRSHIALAQSLVPSIEAAPDAREGSIDRITETQLLELARDGDMVLCRSTAPLIATCFELIATGIPARVKGRDIGKALKTTLGQIANMDDFSYDTFPYHLEVWKQRELRKAQARNASDAAMESIIDRAEALAIFYARSSARTINALGDEIAQLFSDDRAGVTLSTVHRAKGLEAKRVFILRPERLGQPFMVGVRKPLDWEYKAERNVQYVAYTRAKEALYFVEQTPNE